MSDLAAFDALGEAAALPDEENPEITDAEISGGVIVTSSAAQLDAELVKRTAP